MLACIATRVDGVTLFFSGYRTHRENGVSKIVCYWQKERNKALFYSDGRGGHENVSSSRIAGSIQAGSERFQWILARPEIYHFTNREYTFTTLAPYPVAQSTCGSTIEIGMERMAYNAQRPTLPPLSIMLGGWTNELDPNGMHTLETPLALYQFDYTSARIYPLDAELERCPDCGVLFSDRQPCNCDGGGDTQHPHACRSMSYTAPRGTGLEDVSYGLELEIVQCPNYHELTRKTVFKSKTDGSISSSSGREFVSLVLRGTDGLVQTRKFLEMANERKWKIDRSCGFHLHIGTADFTPVQTIRTIAAFRVFQDIFFALVPESRRSNNYCRKASWTWGHAIDAEALQSWNYLVENSGERYRWLNLMSLPKYGTIENRLHGGTLDPYKIEGWIRLNTEIAYHAATTDRSVVDWLTIEREFSTEQKLGELFKLLRPATVKFVKKRLTQFKVVDPKARTVRGFAKIIKEPVSVSAETSDSFSSGRLTDDGE